MANEADLSKINIQLDASYWNQRHKKGDTPWHIKYASPALIGYFEQLENKNLNILIPGAGHEHEALYLLQNGFRHVTLCDISEHAISHLNKIFEGYDSINCIHGDFFELKESYDLIIEQTFFCALHPDLRPAYIEKMYTILNTGGTLAGLLFASEFEKDGPPFGGDINDYKILFSHKLHIHTMQMCYNSITSRSGNEVFFICKKINVKKY
jgi:hypothetical protein